MRRRFRGILAVLGIIGAGCGGEEVPGQPDRPAPPAPVLARAAALVEPTVTVTIDLAGYTGSINIGAFAAAGQGVAYSVPLPSGQHDITAPLAFDETSESVKIGTLTVDAVAGTIAVDSPHFQPAAPSDRVLLLKTVPLPYDHDDTGYFSVGLLGVATISGGGGIYFPRVLDNRRYWMILAQTSNREGTSGVFSPSADLFIRNGCAEIVPGARLAESFSVLNCRLTPRLTVVTVSPSVDIPVALLGVMTLPRGQPVKLFRERLYRFTGPSSLDLETGQAHFSSTFDLFVGAEGGSDIARFVAESKASRYFSTHNRMIEADKVTRLFFDDNDSTTEVEIQPGYPIRSTDLVRGRRYMLRAPRSWDPDDLFSQGFISGRFGAEPGLIIGEDGRLTVTEAVSKHFKVTASPPRLVAKVGNVKFTVNGIKERLRVNAVILPASADRCGTRVLTGRLHQLALIGGSGTPVASTNFTFHFDGHCSPATLTFPQGTIDLDCSL